MHSLIERAALLRSAFHRPAMFNLFTLLRSASDEVRLHSRFLAFLLDPEAAHGAGGRLLELFLEALGIDSFDCQTAFVQVEYRNIDILVRNRQKQALIIENKIYAEDQKEQLFRYSQIMRSEGCTVLEPLYLTLDGRDADPESCRGIAYQRISYATHILAWLERCQAGVALADGVRESLVQYTDLVRKLTLKDQGPYMDKLKETLLQGNNLLLVRDLQKAFTETLKDLQLQLWVEIASQVQRKYKALGEPETSPGRLEVERYYSNARESKYFGIYYPLGFMAGSVYIELNHRFYCGYYCDPHLYSQEHEWLKTIAEHVPNNGNSSNGLLWRYTSELNMKHSSDKDLMALSDPERRAREAERMADDLFDLWREARDLHCASTLVQKKSRFGE